MKSVETFALHPGRRLAGRYEVVQQLGAGWESEVYLVRELETGIERAAKIFFPQRNPRNRTALLTAKKLHRLRYCPALIQYIAQETIRFRGQPISVLISEFVDGSLLNEFVAAQPGKRLRVFEALHLLHALATALEPIHEHREYHGDLHSDNVLMRRAGLGFEIKLIDIHHRPPPKAWNIQDDVCDLVKLLHEVLGGSKHYARQPPEVKRICCGLKRTLILKKFRSAGRLRRHLETLTWEV